MGTYGADYIFNPSEYDFCIVTPKHEDSRYVNECRWLLQNKIVLTRTVWLGKEEMPILYVIAASI